MRPEVRLRHVAERAARAQPVVKILREHREAVAVFVIPPRVAEVIGVAIERLAHARGAQPRLRKQHAGCRRRNVGRCKRRTAAHGRAAARRRDHDIRPRRTQVHRRAGGRIAVVKRAAAVHGRDRERRRLIGGIDIVRVAGGVALAAVARRRDDDHARGIRLREDGI